MPLALSDFVNDFADALATVDASKAPYKTYLPGIGPYSENAAVKAALAWMASTYPSTYGIARTHRLPDLLIPGEWAIELKVIRPFGDNGNQAEHWSENVLHPYAGNTSSLGDCMKLKSSTLMERKAVVIFGFEHTPPRIHLQPAISGFQSLAGNVLNIQLRPCFPQLRIGLVHPVHQQLRVFGYEVL